MLLQKFLVRLQPNNIRQFLGLNTFLLLICFGGANEQNCHFISLCTFCDMRQALIGNLKIYDTMWSTFEVASHCIGGTVWSRKCVILQAGYFTWLNDIADCHFFEI